MREHLTAKKLLCGVLAIVLTVVIAAGTALLVQKRASVTASKTVKNGLSAYELAVQNGYDGTVQEWLSSLSGKSAYALAVQAGYDGTEAQWADRLATLAKSDPVSVKTANFNKNGQMILTLSDGTTLNLGNAVGANGKDGADGKNGVDGKDGADGKDGVGISGVNINAVGELLLHFSDDKSVNLGKVTGATGAQGEKGDKGDTGAQGEKGDTGAQGEKGDKGDTGAQGEKGDTGAQGEKGDKGDTGAQGEKGNTGAQGEKGDKGDTGAQGEKGDKGDTGAQGEKGDKGDTGAQGEKGDKGDTGAQGEKGDTGVGIRSIVLAEDTMTVTLTDSSVFTFENVRGADGKDGISPQIRINAATKMWEISTDNGETWVSTDVTAVGMQGDKGDTGAQGEKGDKGDTGAQGEKGDKGDTGAQGEKGDKGDTGAQGEKGDKGDPGVQGEKGDKGDTGAQGEKGDKGDTGAQGEKGDKGDPGVQGERGDTGAQGEKGEKGDDGISPKLQINPTTGKWEISTDNGLTWTATGVAATGAQGEKGDTGAQGEKGDKGDRGVGITGISLNGDNKLVILLSEGDPIVLDRSLMGEKGEKGETGNGVRRTELTAEGCLVLHYTDGTTSGPLGPIYGRDGRDGVGVRAVAVTDGELYITYTDSETPVCLGSVKGEKGDKGDTGAQGEKGDKGDTGAQGEKGDKGAPGVQGEKGEKGEKGDAGANGRDGKGIVKTEIIDGELWITYTDDPTNAINLGKISDDSHEYLSYTLLDDGTLSVALKDEYKKLVESVSIPSHAYGKPVTQIADFGFGNAKYLTEVRLPNTLKTIGNRAFVECAFTSIDIPNSVKTIGNEAFRKVPLTEVVIPDSVESIGSGAFSVDPPFEATLESVTIGKGVKTIYYDAFAGQKKLQSIVIPSNVDSIVSPFRGCSNLQTVYFEDPNGWFETFSTDGTNIVKYSTDKSVATVFSDPEAAAQSMKRYDGTASSRMYAWYKK